MTAFWPGAAPTRILSWSQLVREADPNFTRDSLQPWIYSFSNGRRFLDTLPAYPDTDDLLLGLYNDGGVLGVEAGYGWPLSTAGLSPGDLWSNAGVASVVGPTAPYPLAQPVYLSQTGALTLLALGGANLPLSALGIPAVNGSGQIFNAGGELWVA